MGAPERARSLALAERPGLAVAGADPGGSGGLSPRTGTRKPRTAARAVGLVLRVRPRSVGATLGSDAGATTRDSPVHQGPAPAVGRPWPAGPAGLGRKATRRAGRRPAQSGQMAGARTRGERLSGRWVNGRLGWQR